MIQENRVRVFVEPILLFLILCLIIEALERILTLIWYGIIGWWGIKVQQSVQYVGLTSLQIVNITASCCPCLCLVLLFHVFEHLVKDVSQ